MQLRGSVLYILRYLLAKVLAKVRQSPRFYSNLTDICILIEIHHEKFYKASGRAILQVRCPACMLSRTPAGIKHETLCVVNVLRLLYYSIFCLKLYEVAGLYERTFPDVAVVGHPLSRPGHIVRHRTISLSGLSNGLSFG